MSWIKRVLYRVLGNKTAEGAGPVATRRPVGRAVVICEATRAMLREGFRSNASASERSTRQLTAIPVTYAAVPPIQAKRGNGQGSTTLPPSRAPSPVQPAKPRNPASSAEPAESVLNGAAWTAPAPSVHGLLNPVDPAGETTTRWSAPVGEAPILSAFGELSSTAALDLSPLSPLSSTPADVLGVDIVGGVPSWSSPEVLRCD